MSCPRIVVRDTPPPQRPVITVGHIYPIQQQTEPAFSTVERVVEGEDAETETKVVKRGRRPSPKATEAAEIK